MPAVSSIDPRTGQAVEAVAPESSVAAVLAAVDLAASAVPWLAAAGGAGRAALLESCAEALEARREALVAIADRETALGPVRLNGELTRTVHQLRFMASVVRDGGYLDVIIDHAGPSPMGPLPDLRRMLVPVGPVAVFGASNFPFAFSVPGGDTAAALAAGCPVVVKAHSSHPATAKACFEALLAGAATVGAPEGVLGLVYGRAAGGALVTAGPVRAVAFTGSTAGGRALFDLAVGRPDPIPFYGELGSLNPLAVTPAAAAARGAEIGEGWVASFTLGVGQFCTKPGLALVPAGSDGDAVRDAAVAAVTAKGWSWMLNGSIRDAFIAGAGRMAGFAGAAWAPSPAEGSAGFAVMPTLVECATADLFAEGSPLLDECFGPAAVLARYHDEEDLLATLARMEGSLTAALHLADGETELPARVLAIAAGFAGRVLVNGYPTGVGVSWSQMHGGPWPAATFSGHTSVGATAIRRFQRPVAFQGVPDRLLPAELRDENPLGVPRRVDGALER